LASILIFVPHVAGEKHILALVVGAIIIAAVGAVDDVISISPWWKLFWQVVVGLVAVSFGVGINFITDPLGGLFRLDNPSWPLVVAGTTYHVTLWADLFTVFWIVAMVNTLNFLDGLDGLAAGVGSIAALVIAGLSLGASVHQPVTAGIALALAGAALGFLPYNFNPAKIFLGDSGAMLIGYVLGVLAIISGGKIATAVLVLGFPILDVLWAIIRRGARGVSPFQADRHHLHHRLLDLGLSQRKVVLLFYVITLSFGSLAVFSTGREKLILFVALAASMVLILLVSLLIVRIRRRTPKKPS
jgi:UDP-GlcNAc:undecaprenyl-phosphate GlcNAc-1-phosphate transferase